MIHTIDGTKAATDLQTEKTESIL